MVLVKTAKELLKSELSVWSIVKSEEDRRYAKIHPAVMPVELARKILELTLEEPVGKRWVLDPMVGVGSVCVAALRLGANCVGVDISADFIQTARRRVREEYARNSLNAAREARPRCKLLQGDARRLDRLLKGFRFDVCVTSPPYFAIMHGRQTFTHGVERPYTHKSDDIGNIFDYGTFIAELQRVYGRVYSALRHGGWLVLVAGDANLLRSNFPESLWQKVAPAGRRHLFFPVHVDLINALRAVGFEIHGIVNWDRHLDYNHLHSIGWSRDASRRWFMTIRVNEYVIFARKPDAAGKRLKS